MPFLDFLKEKWNLIAGAALIIVGLLSGFLDIPQFAAEGLKSEGSYKELGKFVVAGLLALALLPCSLFNKKKYAWKWWIAALALFIAAITFYFIYNGAKKDKTVDYREFSGTLVVKGNKYSEEAEKTRTEYKAQNKTELSDENLLAGFTERNIERIWPRKEITANAITIIVYYLISTALFSLFIIIVIQALYCISKRNGRSLKPKVN